MQIEIDAVCAAIRAESRALGRSPDDITPRKTLGTKWAGMIDAAIERGGGGELANDLTGTLDVDKHTEYDDIPF